MNPRFVGVGGLAHTDLVFVGGFGLTRIPQISQVLLLMVGNLTEVGGHFRPTRIPLLWVDLGSHRFNRFNKNIRTDSGKKRFVKFVGFVVFNHPRISTNYHELFFHVPIAAPFLWIFR